jgi:hypothetical protein
VENAKTQQGLAEVKTELAELRSVQSHANHIATLVARRESRESRGWLRNDWGRGRDGGWLRDDGGRGRDWSWLQRSPPHLLAVRRGRVSGLARLGCIRLKEVFALG